MELTNEFRVGVPAEQAWAVLTDVERIAPCMPGAQLQEIAGDEYRGVVKVKVGPITAQYKGKATFLSRDDKGHVAVLKAEGRDTRGQGNASAKITATLKSDGDSTIVTVVTDLTVTGKVAQFGRGVLADVSGKLLTQFVDCLEQDLLAEAATASAVAESLAAPAPKPEPAPAPAPKPAAKPAPAASPAPVAPAAKAEPAPAPRPSPAPAAKAEPAPAPKPAPAPVPKPEPAAAPPAPAAKVAEEEPAKAEVNGHAPSEPVVRKIEHKEAEPVDLLDAAGVPVAKRAIPIVAGVLLILWFLRRRRRRNRERD